MNGVSYNSSMAATFQQNFLDTAHKVIMAVLTFVSEGNFYHDALFSMPRYRCNKAIRKKLQIF